MASDARDGLWTFSCNGVIRRMVRLPLSIIEGVSRAMMGRRIGGPINGGESPPPQPQGLPVTPNQERDFLASFEQQFGDSHPFFYACQFVKALKMAKDESKFVFVYLHAPEHHYTAPFCRNTLCSELAVEFLDANFVSWGALARSGEGLQMVTTLQAATFPFCAVVAPASDDGIAVLQQVEGPVSPSELVEILQRTIEEQGSAFRTLRTAAEARRVNRRLREEQDAAYLTSLQIDKEKEKVRELPIEDAAAQAPAEAWRKADWRNPATKQSSKRTRQSSKETHQQKEIVGPKRNQSITQILIRFPNGERRVQSFLSDDKIWSIYRYIDSLDIPGIGSYQLISNFPRKLYAYEQLEMTLKDAGLHPKATLFLELL